jgi:hypothetical protein
MTRRPKLARIAAAALAGLLPNGGVGHQGSPAPVPAVGTLVTRGEVRVGSSAAPSGTTVFDGDRVYSMGAAALIRLDGGGTVEMVNAVAALSARGAQLVIKPERGLIRFSVEAGRQIDFHAGRYRFAGSRQSERRVGELGLDGRGRIAMILTSGSFALSREDGAAEATVRPGTPAVILDQFGRGSVVLNGRSLTDRSAQWRPGELRAQCVNVEGLVRRIVENTRYELTIEGSWTIPTGVYDYVIADCGPTDVTVAKVQKPRSRGIWIGVGAAAAAAAVIGAVAGGAGGSSSPPPSRSPS